MTQRPKDIGTAAETAVVRYLQGNGFPHAERRALRGTYDCGDVTGIPGVVIEVKGGKAAKCASDGQVAAWLAETETERLNARADVGVLVMARAGIGPANAGRWWAVVPSWFVLAAGTEGVPPHQLLRNQRVAFLTTRLHLADVVTLLRHAGTGDPLDQEATA